jgi:hypothetical protein
MSAAMDRVALALKKNAPADVTFTKDLRDAELAVLHVIGTDAVEFASKLTIPYAVIQYCCQPRTTEAWHHLWYDSVLTWSYYDLSKIMPVGASYMHAPLGCDPLTFGLGRNGRFIGAVTSGYVAGPGAEAIEEMAEACQRLGMDVIHVGPMFIEGMRTRREPTWCSRQGISDPELSSIYRSSKWVSGLRFGEGFELPALEGLLSGCRPILFDRDDAREWYNGHAVFVRECSGEPLIEQLMQVMAQPPEPVTEEERSVIAERFSWPRIAGEFWGKVLS